MERHKCSATVWTGRCNDNPCCKPGKLNENGKWWCSVHAPSAVAKRRQDQQEKWDAKWKQDREHWQREQAVEEVTSDLSIEELQEIKSLGGAKKLLEKARLERES